MLLPRPARAVRCVGGRRQWRRHLVLCGGITNCRPNSPKQEAVTLGVSPPSLRSLPAHCSCRVSLVFGKSVFHYAIVLSLFSVTRVRCPTTQILVTLSSTGMFALLYRFPLVLFLPQRWTFSRAANLLDVQSGVLTGWTQSRRFARYVLAVVLVLLVSVRY